MTLRTNIFHYRVAFSDCDPAQIVFYANYFKWFDAACFEYFWSCGVPAWRELTESRGIVGAPLVNATAKFFSSATYGDKLEIETSISEWRNKSFVMRHVIHCGNTLLVEGEETRVFAIADPDDSKRIKAIPIPTDLRVMCE